MMSADFNDRHGSENLPAAAGIDTAPETTLAVLGHAQVLVVINAGESQRAPASLEFTHGGETLAAGTRRVAAEVERHFIAPANAQDAALVQSRVSSGARRIRKSLNKHTGTAKAAERVASSVSVEVPKIRVYENLGVILGTVDAEGLQNLRSDPRVQAVYSAPQISLIRPTRTTLQKKRKGITYGLGLLGIPDLWKAGITGTGVVVGHLDTGVDASHPVLKGAIAGFVEFDLLGKEVPNAKPRDTDEHGTHTAGTIVGRKVAGMSFGVAPGARLASAIVIEGGNVIARILAGMNWVVGQRVHILSMSLGLRGYTGAFLALVRILRARGVLPVFAVGNEYAGTSRSPGNYAEALSIGACDSARGVADFSSSQAFTRHDDPIVPDVVGPGVDVYSCIPSGKYAELSGTSMATPHIAGLAALLMQAAPNASITQVERAIIESASLAPGMIPDRAGHGLPNGPTAYKLLTGSELPKRSSTRGKRGGIHRRQESKARGRVRKRALKRAAPRR